MTPELISAIQTFTLDSRKLLERETEEQLQGLYGWLPDGSFGVGTALGLPEAAETRARLERYVAEEKDAGLDAAAARAKLKRETAFTWLNRAVAFRLMEERSIIRSTFGKLHKANAFIYYITDVLGEASIPAAMPINAMAEGPVDAAYRKFLLWQCGQLADAVSVLFDPATLASRLCPRPAVLKELAETMNAAGLAAAWMAGNEETIGWVYQGFNAEEKAATFASFQAGKKITADRIGAATQVFTPSWVVRYLVENSVGRLWLDMHPDSSFSHSLEYLIPLSNSQERSMKPVSEITFLDPSCGSMDFGLIAFDLFVEMYREEMKNAGKPGWPLTPSAPSEDQIPELVLSRNIHGIDLDMRAVQISAFALLLRARTMNPKAQTTDNNIACANVEQITGGRLDEFISATKFSHPIYERVLRRLASRLKESDHLGSLLRIEVEIEQLVAAERKTSKNAFSQLPGMHPEQFDSQEGIEQFFEIITDQIGQHLDHFVQASRANGEDGGMFAREAAKGLRFLRLVERRYDVVATNPPYLDSRDYSAVHKAYLESQFPAGKRNLFAAFIQRCMELADPRGLVAMITGQSFMFISSYELLREELLKDGAIQTLAQFDYHLFRERVDTTAFVLRREPEAAQRNGQIATYFRLVKERDADAKRIAFESTLASLRLGNPHHQAYNFKQCDFDPIPGKPWVYWITMGMNMLFRHLDLLEKAGQPRQGLATGENVRFVRFWWEPGLARVSRNCKNIDEALSSTEIWFPYNKGGGPKAWYGNQSNVIRFDKRSFDVLSNQGNHLPSRHLYFNRGVTWSLIASKGFAARLSPGGFIFDVAGMTCFPAENFIPVILAVLNSRVGRFILSALNPTINYQVGDIERLPVPNERSLKNDELVNQCVQLSRQNSCENEITYDFIRPIRAITDLTARKEQLAALEGEIDAEVSRLYGLSEGDLAAIDREFDGPTGDEYNNDAEDEDTGSGNDEDDAGGDLNPADWARSWISYALGTVLGRFEIGKPGGLGCGDFPEATAESIHKLIDPDGIMPCEAGHPQDLAARAFACLELMLGATEARDAVRNATGTDGEPVELLRGWLDRFTGQPAASFWKFHHQLYRKRPVYWPFQSPQKTFTVWVFHEKIGPNTLHAIKELADVQLNLLERKITDLRPAAATNRAKEKDLQKLLEQSDDIREFSNRLKAHIDAGYQSCIDDGVLLNAAPLHDLFPNWTDTKKAWEELKAEKYEWSHQAMRHWPDRVTEACRSNRSFAIAHGVEHLCPAAPPRKAAKKAAKKAGKMKLDLESLL